MSFLEWILNKLRSDREKENTWEPVPLRIEDVYPDNEYPVDDEGDPESDKTVIIIDI